MAAVIRPPHAIWEDAPHPSTGYMGTGTDIVNHILEGISWFRKIGVNGETSKDFLGSAMHNALIGYVKESIRGYCVIY